MNDVILLPGYKRKKKLNKAPSLMKEAGSLYLENRTHRFDIQLTFTNVQDSLQL